MVMRSLQALLLSAFLGGNLGESNNVDSVRISLQDYQALFRQAYLQDLRQSAERERKEVWRDVTNKDKELQSCQESLRSDSRQKAQRHRVLPGNWQLVNHSAEGIYRLGAEPEERSMATFGFTLDFRIFEDEWTAIRLFDAQSIVTDWSVLRIVGNGSDWEPVQLGLDTLLVLKDRELVKDEEPWQDHTLVTNTAGWYRVHFQAFLRVRESRGLHSLQLNLLYPLASTRLRLQHDAGAGHIRELSVEPAAFFDVKRGNGSSDIHVRLPSSTVVEVKWRLQAGPQPVKTLAPSPGGEAQAAAVAAEDPQPAQATVTHDSLHSLADGILQSSHNFKYSLDSEQSLSSVSIVIGGPVRVSSVVALGMQTWRVVPVSNLTALGLGVDASAAAAGSGVAVHVAFKSSAIARDVIVQVATELEFEAEAGLVELPPVVCQGVLRQAGTMAVVKVANVEVYQHSATGVVTVGAGDVPSHVRGRASRPIVLAYRFLSPRHSVTLSVLRHKELRTLEAVADAVLYQALVVDVQAMHSLLLVLQNTQRQYIEIRGIPPAATLWSLKVNSLAAKPVLGPKGSLMVPLLVGPSFGVDGGASAKTSVELAWLSQHEPLGASGNFSLNPPQLDMPISALSVEVQFPGAYMVSFAGSMEQVQRFSQKQAVSVSYDYGEEIVAKDFDFASMPPPTGGGAAPKEGVKAKVPKVGTRYRFEKVLVVNGSATLSASYSPAPPMPSTDSTGWAVWAASMLR